jgi:uncharacterized protein YjbI with pentapeptide repeats
MKPEQHPIDAPDKEQQSIGQRALAFSRALVSDWRPLGSDWRPTTKRQRLWITRVAIVLAISVAIGYPFDITLWDWLKLLIVPAVIAGGAVWFNHQQRERELAIEDKRTQDAILEAYIIQMSELLVSHKLLDSRQDDVVRTVAQGQTSAVLPRLDGPRKGNVVRFLHNTSLIKSSLINEGHPIINLNALDLEGAILKGADLRGADLTRALLRDADLRDTTLANANLFRANLDNADLSYTWSAHVQLPEASLEHATLHKANLESANLQNANLVKAKLTSAVLFSADLNHADLTDADLTDANLSRAKTLNTTVTAEQLERAGRR